jgi:predicted patatin/cPLA2 family phospholipase|tara:strand:+ start:1060 stop:1299 length:240 start_codon:yes stop_codon:yes gene_type:complete
LIKGSAKYSDKINALNQLIAQMMHEQSTVYAEISQRLHHIQDSNNDIEIAAKKMLNVIQKSNKSDLLSEKQQTSLERDD